MNKNQHSTHAEQTPTTPPALETLRQVLDQPVAVKLQLLQHYAERARLLATEIMDEEALQEFEQRSLKSDEATESSG